MSWLSFNYVPCQHRGPSHPSVERRRKDWGDRQSLPERDTKASYQVEEMTIFFPFKESNQLTQMLHFPCKWASLPACFMTFLLARVNFFLMALCPSRKLSQPWIMFSSIITVNYEVCHEVVCEYIGRSSLVQWDFSQLNTDPGFVENIPLTYFICNTEPINARLTVIRKHNWVAWLKLKSKPESKSSEST